MYIKNTNRLPIKIPRDKFVDIVFELGFTHEHSYESIITSVEIADTFVHHKGQRTPFLITSPKLKKKLKKQVNDDIMKKCVSQHYSKELAYVVTIIVGKSNEDDGFDNITDAVEEINNIYLYKMEWEVSIIIGFTVKVKNYMTFISKIIIDSSFQQHYNVSKFFYYLSKVICKNKTLLSANPATIVLALKLLHRRGKCKIYRQTKTTQFGDLIDLITKDYDLDIMKVIRAFKTELKLKIV